MALGPGGAPRGTKDPLGGHQNMPTGSPLGPATRVRILAPVGSNAFDSIAGQTYTQTAKREGRFPSIDSP